ncbi:zinc transporter ZupT [Candidatus Margulisiibacteriota bacterium]
MDNIFFAFSLTLFAGLGTGIGSALTFFTKRTNVKALVISLGFSAGVMLYVSMFEIFSKAKESLIFVLGEETGTWITVLAFFGGIGLIGLIDYLIPEYENMHEMKSIEDMNNSNAAKDFKKLHRVGLFTAIAIIIHNFPEGLATFVAALKDPKLGIAIATAIAIHNIPEGIAVSIPIYYATGNKLKAFWYSFFSGLAEPLGALIGILILLPFMNDLIFGILFALVAGIMVYISLDELLPSSEKYGYHHLTIGGVIVGMGVMALSLLFFL